MNLPSSSDPGYRRFRSHVACDEQAIWLWWLERCYLKHGIVRECIDVYQLVGGAAASGGTHVLGAASDIAQHGRLAIRISRLGCGAAWPRTSAQGFTTPHQHVVIRCPHDAHCRYQWDALANGYDGLAGGGRDYAGGASTLARGDWAEGVRQLQRVYYCGWLRLERRTKTLTTAGGHSARVKGYLRKGHRIYLTGYRAKGPDGTLRLQYRTKRGTAWAVEPKGVRDLRLPAPPR